MGNSKSRDLFICTGQEGGRPNHRKTKRYVKDNLSKIAQSKQMLKHMIEDENFKQFQEIKEISPIDQSIQYLVNYLENSNNEWAHSLLLNFVEKMQNQMDKKYKTYKWNIEVNLQKQALRHQAIRECLSDSTKADIFNLSTSGDNSNNINGGALLSRDFGEDDIYPSAATLCKDGSIVLLQNSNSTHIMNSHHETPSQLISGSPYFGGALNKNEISYPNIIIDSTCGHNSSPRYNDEMTMPNIQSRKLSDMMTMKKAHSLEIENRTFNFEKIRTFLDTRQNNDLFKRQVKIIKRHFKNSQHPLRILLDLFAKELISISKSPLLQQSEMGDSQCSRVKTQLKLSEREMEFENQNQMKVVKFKKIEQAVKDFSLLLKHAITRFYQIEYNKLRQFQKNYFTKQVKEIVLGYKVSKIIYDTAAEAYREEIIEFQKALTFLSNIEVNFFSVNTQFLLDEQLYSKKDEKENNGKEEKIKIDFQNMEAAACQFRMCKMIVNKSQSSPFGVEEDDNQIPMRLSEKYISSKKILDSVQEKQKNDGMSPDKTLIMNKTILTNTKTIMMKSIPYQKSIQILKQLPNVTSLRRKKQIFIYVWQKLQKEIFDFWKDKNLVKKEKQILYEDARLCLMSYAIIQTQSVDVYTSFLALKPFIDENRMEEALPMATVESAIQVILKDFEDFQTDEVDSGSRAPSQSKRKDSCDEILRMVPSQVSYNLSFTSRKSTAYFNQRDELMKRIQELTTNNQKQDSMNQEEEEKELQQRLNANFQNELTDIQRNNQKEFLKKWRLNSPLNYHRSTFQKNREYLQNSFLSSMQRKSNAGMHQKRNTKSKEKLLTSQIADKQLQQSSLFLDFQNTKFEVDSSYSNNLAINHRNQKTPKIQSNKMILLQ